MRSSRLTWLAIAFGALIAAGCGETSISPSPPSATATPIYTPTPVGLETPASGSIYLGAYVSPSPNGGIATLEKQVHRKLALSMHYYTWAGLFPATNEDNDVDNLRLPVESWDCGASNAAVASGAQDLLIQTRAQAVKNFGHPVFLRYMWDANLPPSVLGRSQCYDPATDNADGSFSASEYVAAWQHIRSIFAAENVTNVVWVWNMSASGTDPRAYFPGSTEVDWVGVDAYDASNVGFAAAFAPAYALVSPFGKPMLVAETGSAPADQGAFFAAVPSALQTQFPMVDGLMYYDGTNAIGAWALSPAGATAFTTLATNPYFAATGSL